MKIVGANLVKQYKGRRVVNDVTAWRDPDMGAVVAARGAATVLMHMRGEPDTMDKEAVYDDVVAEARVAWPSDGVKVVTKRAPTAPSARASWRRWGMGSTQKILAAPAIRRAAAPSDSYFSVRTIFSRPTESQSARPLPCAPV